MAKTTTAAGGTAVRDARQAAPAKAPAHGGDRGDLTRQRILDAAAAAFAEGGYAGTSLNDIIRATGLTKGGFYFHFPSKQALAVACLDYKRERWIGRVMAEATRHRRAIDQLASIPLTLCDLYEQDPTYRCIGRLCMELASEDLQDIDPAFFSSAFDGWIQITTSLLRRGQQEGDVRADLDPDEAAFMAVATVVGIDEMTSLMTGGADYRRRIEAFIPLFLNAIRA
jgi:AcrR family transcriptional regulator